MKQKEISEGCLIQRKGYSSTWLVIRKYAKDFILIQQKHGRHNVVCLLSGGQFKLFNVVQV